jgi:hypothetical protein
MGEILKVGSSGEEKSKNLETKQEVSTYINNQYYI